jgi:pilus assembly protein CpaB
MGAARIVILSLALVAAIGLAVVVRGMISARKAPVAVAEARAPEIKLARVLVAARELPIGTHLSPADLRWQSWPAETLNPAFFTDGAAPAPEAKGAVEKATAGAAKVIEQMSGSGAIESLVGVIVRDPILAGEPITRGKLVPGGEGGYLAVVLPPGMQALGVPIKIENVAGGFILPGDRVDISQSKEVDKPSGEGRMRTTDVIVRNVRVLAIDQATKPAENANTIAASTTATLEVTPDAALALVEAMEQGALHLALKSYNDNGPRSVVVQPRTRVARESIRAITIFSQGDTQEVEVRQ